MSRNRILGVWEGGRELQGRRCSGTNSFLYYLYMLIICSAAGLQVVFWGFFPKQFVDYTMNSVSYLCNSGFVLDLCNVKRFKVSLKRQPSLYYQHACDRLAFVHRSCFFMRDSITGDRAQCHTNQFILRRS